MSLPFQKAEQIVTYGSVIEACFYMDAYETKYGQQQQLLGLLWKKLAGRIHNIHRDLKRTVLKVNAAYMLEHFLSFFMNSRAWEDDIPFDITGEHLEMYRSWIETWGFTTLNTVIQIMNKAIHIPQMNRLKDDIGGIMRFFHEYVYDLKGTLPKGSIEEARRLEPFFKSQEEISNEVVNS